MSEKLTLSETAAHYKVSERTFKKYIKLYKLPFVLFGRTKRFELLKVEAKLQSLALETEAGNKVELARAKPAKHKAEIKPKRADFWRRELGLS